MPGVSCTVAEQIEALRSVAGNDVVKLIKPELDERIVKIVAGWPRDFQTDRAHSFGLKVKRILSKLFAFILKMIYQKFLERFN